MDEPPEGEVGREEEDVSPSSRKEEPVEIRVVIDEAELPFVGVERDPRYMSYLSIDNKYCVS